MRISILSFLYSTFSIASIFLLITAVILVDGFLSQSAFASAAIPSFSGMKEDTSWHISALKVSYDNENQIYIAEGEVILTGIKKLPGAGMESNEERRPENSGETKLKADYVEFSNITKNAVASGNVLLVSGKDSITCERLKFNLETETGTIYNGIVFIEENHFYIKGDTIEKSGKESYRSDKASVTSCDGENPDWKLSGKDIKVSIDGYGTAKSATLWAGKIPALYSPIVLFPAKTTRQTGLLTPRISSSDNKGFEVEQPLFIAISRGMDATLYEDYMSKRGLKMGLEYRYVLNDDSSGTMFYDYLNDGKIDDGSPLSVDYSFASTPTRSNHDRYWFRMKNSHTFDNEWHTRLDIDYVSDADYLREFRDGFTGFDSASRYFRETSGRSLDEYDDTTRENSFNINRIWTGASLNMGMQWFDNVVSRQTGSSDYTLQKLPSIEFNTVKKKVGTTPLYYDLDYEYRYFYRQDTRLGFSPTTLMGTAEPLHSGHRTDIFPRVYMPIKVGAFYLEPSAGVRQSLWYVSNDDEWELNNSDKSQSLDFKQTVMDHSVMDHFNHRELFDLNLELSTKLSRVFNIDNNNSDNNFAEKIKHEIIPRVEYSFVPEVSQGDLPHFDDLDYIKDENLVTWSLANRLTSRSKIRINPSEDSRLSGSTNPSINITKSSTNSGNINKAHDPYFIYREFAWIEISQSYRIDSDESDYPVTSDESIKSDSLRNLDNFFESESLFMLNNYPGTEKSFKTGRSFSDISAEIEFAPASFFSINSDVKWSPYDNRFTSHDSGMTIRDNRGDALEAWYRYEEAESESMFASLSAKLTDSFNMFLVCEHSLTDNRNIESHTGFYFYKPCWSMRVAYSDAPEGESLSLIINLHGIGEFGKK